MIQEIIAIFKNWRCCVLLALTIVTMLLVFACSDNFKHLFAIKFFAFVFGYIFYALYTKWRKEGKINELTNFNTED